MEGALITKSESETRSRVITNVSYSVFIVIGPDVYAGRVVLAFTLLESFDIWLDFEAKSVEKLLVNSLTSEIRHENSRIYLQGLESGENRVEIHYQNTYSVDPFGLIKINDSLDNETYIYTQFEPFAANRCFPCFDQPDLKASFRLNVLTPSSWTVVSNTPESSPEEISSFYCGGLNISNFQPTSFKPTLPISSYLVALCAGRFIKHSMTNSVSGIPCSLYCRQSVKSSLNPEIFFSWIDKALVYYQVLFDFPYPFEKYDQVFVPDHLMYAMENVGCVTMDEKCLNSDSKSHEMFVCMLVTHEMSHMWFGDIVTLKWWDDIWLNESFATFISCLCMAELGLFEEVWQLFYDLQQRGVREDQLSTAHPVSMLINSTVEIFSNFDGICYFRGSSVLKQLFFVLGRESFIAAIRSYIKSFQYSNATFNDLISKFSEFSEQLRLEDWAKSWIKTSGVNVLMPVVERCEGNIVGPVNLKQIDQEIVLRDHMVYVDVYNKDFELIKHLKVVIEKDMETLIEISGDVMILINAENEGYCKVRFDQWSYEKFCLGFWRVKSPLSRLQIFVSLLGMIKDNIVSPYRLIEIIKENLVNENDEFNVNYIVKHTKDAFYSYFTDSKYIKSCMKVLHEILLEKHTRRQGDGSLIKLLIKTIFNYESVSNLLPWLDEGSTVKLSQKRRWKLLMKYAAITNLSKPMVDKEKIKDPSIFGYACSLYCEAAYPSLENKERAWNRILNSHEMTTAQRLHLMTGFNNYTQKAILNHFSDRYFDWVPKIIESSTFEFSEQFVKYLAPKSLNHQQLVCNFSSLIQKIPEFRGDLINIIKQYIDEAKLNEKLINF